MGHRRCFAERLDDASLVVCRHQRDVGRSIESIRELAHFQSATGVHRGFQMIPREALHIAEHRAVLDGGDDSSPLPCEPVQRVQSGIDAFRAASGEKDFPSIGTDPFADLATRLVDGLASEFRRGIGSRGIRKTLTQPRQHRFQDFRQQRRRGVGIQINHCRSIRAWSPESNPEKHSEFPSSAEFIDEIPAPAQKHITPRRRMAEPLQREFPSIFQRRLLR